MNFPDFFSMAKLLMLSAVKTLRNSSVLVGYSFSSAKECLTYKILEFYALSYERERKGQ
jgi:hypothetical protein